MPDVIVTDTAGPDQIVNTGPDQPDMVLVWPTDVVDLETRPDVRVRWPVDDVQVCCDPDVVITCEGPPGPPGPAGPSSVVTLLSARALGADRLVISTGGFADYADTTDPTHLTHDLFLTLNSTNAAGQPVDVLLLGVHTEPSWSWTPDELIFAGRAGALTQVFPTIAAGDTWFAVAGTVMNPTTVFFDPEPPVQLI